MFSRFGSRLSRNFFANTQYKKKEAPTVFLKLSDGSRDYKLRIRLFEESLPETSENFRQLCTGESKITYKGASVSKAVPNVFVEIGSGLPTIYGAQMKKESLSTAKFDRKGLVTMVSQDNHHHTSRFAITLTDFSHLDYSSVVVGEVIEGLDQVQALSRNADGSKKVAVTECGEAEPFVLVEDHHHHDHHDGHGHEDAHHDSHSHDHKHH